MNPDKVPDGKVFLCSIEDISVNGICTVVPFDLPIGSRIEIWLKSKNHEGTLKVLGKVAWCREREDQNGLRAGIELKNDDSDDYKAHQRRVAERLLDQIKPDGPSPT